MLREQRRTESLKKRREVIQFKEVTRVDGYPVFYLTPEEFTLLEQYVPGDALKGTTSLEMRDVQPVDEDTVICSGSANPCFAGMFVTEGKAYVFHSIVESIPGAAIDAASSDGVGVYGGGGGNRERVANSLPEDSGFIFIVPAERPKLDRTQLAGLDEVEIQGRVFDASPNFTMIVIPKAMSVRQNGAEIVYPKGVYCTYRMMDEADMDTTDPDYV